MNFTINDLTALQLVACLEVLGEFKNPLSAEPLHTFKPEVKQMNEELTADEENILSTVMDGPKQTEIPMTANGIEWDERIHASTKAINTDGNWKRRKGVPDIEYNRIMTEKRVGVLVEPPVIQSPPVEIPALIIPPPPPVTSEIDYNTFVAKVSHALTGGMTMVQVVDALKMYGYSTVWDLKDYKGPIFGQILAGLGIV
jgi:hypothetical protein